MKRLAFTIISSITFLFGCNSLHTANDSVTSSKPELSLSQQDKWNLMVGKWYGSQPTTDGGVKKQITQRSSLGDYKHTFRIYDVDGNYEEHIEVGEWGVSGQIYFSIFKGWILRCI